MFSLVGKCCVGTLPPRVAEALPPRVAKALPPAASSGGGLGCLDGRKLALTSIFFSVLQKQRAPPT
jgi:hypothetical protein